ncbi:MAG: hypothetical protein WA496_05010 [Candidatus Udaeobacter sp.]
MARALPGNIFLNIGGKYPNQAFTAGIPSASAAQFPHPQQYEDRTVAKHMPCLAETSLGVFAGYLRFTLKQVQSSKFVLPAQLQRQLKKRFGLVYYRLELVRFEGIFVML